MNSLCMRLDPSVKGPSVFSLPCHCHVLFIQFVGSTLRGNLEYLSFDLLWVFDSAATLTLKLDSTASLSWVYLCTMKENEQKKKKVHPFQMFWDESGRGDYFSRCLLMTPGMCCFPQWEKLIPCLGAGWGDSFQPSCIMLQAWRLEINKLLPFAMCYGFLCLIPYLVQ